jgi:hypothetical protein
MINRKWITGIGTLFLFMSAQAQSPLVAYAAASSKEGVLISFTMRGGFSCNGINIERSEDSVSFSVIGDIEGICGNPDFDQSFTYTDRQPLSFRKNYYRLDMKQLGYSPVFTVFYTQLNSDDVLIIPNPCSENCTLYFENTKREKVVIKLFYNAKEMFTQITDQDFMELKLGSSAAGVYYCRLQFPDGTLRNILVAAINH